MSSDIKQAVLSWNSLYKIGFISTLMTVLTIILSIISFFIWPLFPKDIFTVIQQNRIAGIMSLDILYLISVLFTLPIILVFYVTFSTINKSLSLILLVLGFLSIVLLINARPILEILSLSDKYAASTTEAEKLQYLAAGKATLELFNGTAYNVHLLFGNTSFLISSFLMIRSKVFSKRTAIIGIITNLVAFGMLIPFVGPFVGLVFLIGFIPWLILIAFNLLKFVNNNLKKETA
jgi:hypothetical protein